MSSKIESILQVYRDLKDEIRRRYKAEIIGVFGSYARGEEKESSDLDVLVRFLEGASLFDFVGLANFLEDKLQLKVDIVPIDTIREEIKGYVLKEAIYI